MGRSMALFSSMALVLAVLLCGNQIYKTYHAIRLSEVVSSAVQGTCLSRSISTKPSLDHSQSLAEMSTSSHYSTTMTEISMTRCRPSSSLDGKNERMNGKAKKNG